MKKIRNAVLKLVAFFVFYYSIGFSAIAIQWIGFMFNFDRVFGVLFDPTYQLNVLSNLSCDRILNYNRIILYTVSFIFIWLFFSKKMDSSLKKILTVSYLVLTLTMILRLLPSGIGLC